MSKIGTNKQAPRLARPAPDFELPDESGVMRKLSDYRGKWVALYFYPKDNTPGCTLEACSFRDEMSTLKKQGIAVLGVSADSVKSHEKFSGKFKLNFPLFSDANKEVIKKYGVWGEKTMMGRKYMGIFRTTFLIDPEGKIAKIYENVKPEGHAKEIVADVTAFKNK